MEINANKYFHMPTHSHTHTRVDYREEKLLKREGGRRKRVPLQGKFCGLVERPRPVCVGKTCWPGENERNKTIN